MTDAAASNRDVRLMRELIDELRAESPPELDWPSIEERGLARIGPTAAWRRFWRAESGSVAALRRGAGLAAAAAAVALMIASSGPNDGALGSHSELGLLRSNSGAEHAAAAPLSVGPSVRVTTESVARQVEVEGLGRWRLEPNGAATVRRTAGPYVVALERGTVVVEVTPAAAERAVVESFVVEVGHTRVAVHGTMFSVTRLADTVRIDVLRGTVAIGPAGHRGLTIGRLLVAPASAEFSLDGGREARLLPEPTPQAVAMADARSGAAPTTDPFGEADSTRLAPERPARRSATPQQRGSEPPLPIDLPPANGGPASGGDPAARELEGGPTGEPVDPVDPPAAPLTASHARAQIAGCLAATDGGSGGTGVRVTISTQATLHRTPEGRVGSVQFNPPLRPDLQRRCAGPLLGQPLAGSEKTVVVSVVVAPR